MGHVELELRGEWLVHPQPFPVGRISGYGITVFGVVNDDAALVAALCGGGICGDEMRDGECQDRDSHHHRDQQEQTADYELVQLHRDPSRGPC